MGVRRMEWRVLSREAAERYEPEGVELCISISDPSAPPARLAAGFAEVLRLAFNDIQAAGSADDVLFDDEHAAAVLEVVARWPGVERIVVHCHAGVSRSPAVALGVCDVLGLPAQELERAHPFWNRWVRGVLARAGRGRGADAPRPERPRSGPSR